MCTDAWETPEQDTSGAQSWFYWNKQPIVCREWKDISEDLGYAVELIVLRLMKKTMKKKVNYSQHKERDSSRIVLWQKQCSLSDSLTEKVHLLGVRFL